MGRIVENRKTNFQAAHDLDLRQALRERTAGPGGFYNLGNAVALGTGIALQLRTASATGTGVSRALLAYFVGSPSATALTVATVVFFVSGEVYHRAWQAGTEPNPALLRRGDFLSAVGAVALGIGLLLLDQPLLAAFSGLLHALGKLGNSLPAVERMRDRFWPRHLPDPFRLSVVVSRLPALLATGLALLAAIAGWTLGNSEPDVAASSGLIVAYLLWTKADVMLLRA